MVQVRNHGRELLYGGLERRIVLNGPKPRRRASETNATTAELTESLALLARLRQSSPKWRAADLEEARRQDVPRQISTSWR